MSLAAVALLGLSGWFIAGAALAGGAGAAAAHGFNYLTPSAVIRLRAILRTGALERLGRRLEDRGQGLILISHRRAPIALCDRVLAAGGVTSGGRVAIRPADRWAAAAVGV